MMELYENYKTEFNASNPDVVRSVIPKRTDFLDTMYLVEDVSESHLLVFELPTTGKDEIFSYAELKILTLVKRAKESTNGIRKQISVSVYDETQRKFNKVHMLHIHHTKNTWLSFNLTNQVAKILNNRGSSKNLQVAVTTSSIISLYSEETYNLKLSLLPSNEHNFEHDYPILLLSYVSNSSQDYGENVKEDKKRKNIRRRRFIDEDYYEEETNNIWDDLVSKKIHEKKLKRSKNACKRKPLHINFAEINYDEWIVQPSGYEAFQCQGKCFYPVAEHLSPTKHAIVQALLHSVAPSRASRSCCVPTSLGSISILYVDDTGVLTYRYAYRDMVVLECGCR